MKYKKIPKDYFTTILDRLTRFEPAYIRYSRVINDIINKFYLENHKNSLDINEKINISCQIFNNSLQSGTDSNYLNELFINLEDKYFMKNELSYQYLSTRFNINQMINEIEYNNKLPQNLIWLKSIVNSREDIFKLREKKSLLYPIEKIILCEGQTEELLLETVCKLFDLDFKKSGIKVISAGGKNQVARKFYQMIEYTKLPFFVLLDKDAIKIHDIIKPKLRPIDSLYIINSGEFEDLFPNEILLNAINSIHTNDFQCILNDFDCDVSMVNNLENIYKKYGFGDFKKAEFARLLAKYIEKNNCYDTLHKSEFYNIVKTMNSNSISFTS